MRRFISTMAQQGPRRFAPLKEASSSHHHDLPKLQGVIFDVDGTLCLPQNYMFAEMRRALNISRSVDILEHVYALPTAAAQDSAMASIRAIERAAMASQAAQPGLAGLMAYLDARRVRKGICTRNFELPVAHLLAKFLAQVEPFHPVVTRDFRPPKPDPAGLLFIARAWGLVRPARGDDDAAARQRQSAAMPVGGETSGASEGGEEKEEVEAPEHVADASGLIMVGDSIDDMTAGRRAGAATVLLVNDANRHLAEHEHTDLVIERLDELVDVLDRGFVGREIPRPVA
ncbi:HAD-like protein [Hypoxylon sp. FL1284]|nr:HAD-like protein [Hypoxylon sp. FL1284]